MTLIVQRPSMMEIMHAIEVLQKRKKRRRVLITIACILLVLCALAFAASRTVAVPVRYAGHGMDETLSDGELTLVNGFRYVPAAGDIVACSLQNQESDGFLIARVIALGGSTVAVDPETGAVSVDGKALEEPYLTWPGIGNMDTEPSVTVPEGTVYLLGDNRPEAIDSRMRKVGCVPVDAIRGKVWAVLYPGIRSVK